MKTKFRDDRINSRCVTITKGRVRVTVYAEPIGEERYLVRIADFGAVWLDKRATRAFLRSAG